MFFMPIFWLLIVVGVIMVVAAALQSQSAGGGAGSVVAPTETALDILKKRYARGEIGQEEFEEKRRILERQ